MATRQHIRANDLTKCTYGAVKGIKYDLAVLPWGATEPHNLHLPYLTDAILAQAIAVDAVERAENTSNIRAMVLPPITLGSQNPGQRELPFCIHARYETQKAILTDIVASLNQQNINRLVILNGHGGNGFKNMVRDLSLDFPHFLIAVSDWFDIVPQSGFFEEKDDHAGEVETSVMLYYRPELVSLEEAGEGASKPFGLQSLNEKIAWIPRDWAKVSRDTGIGNPEKSSVEKGEQYIKAVIEKLSQLFIELVQGVLY